MDRTAATLILKGLATYVPGYLPLHNKYRAQPPGGASTAGYCYSAWLRHLVAAHESGLDTEPSAVGELGPGASLGVGLCALLTGASTYYALDICRYATLEGSARMLPELVALLKRRADIPSDDETDLPVISSTAFPSHILTEQRLSAALADERVESIGRALAQGEADDLTVRYVAPWSDPAVVPAGSLDIVLSQAVLEHVDSMRPVYEAMFLWLKPGGYMSHQVDYRSHGTAATWDGHWTYSDIVWQLINGRRPKVISRASHSDHVAEVRRAGFEVCGVRKVETPSAVDRRGLAPRFRGLSDEDRTCSEALVQARKPIG